MFVRMRGVGEFVTEQSCPRRLPADDMWLINRITVTMQESCLLLYP
jgi:hypothetical protein